MTHSAKALASGFEPRTCCCKPAATCCSIGFARFIFRPADALEFRPFCQKHSLAGQPKPRSDYLPDVGIQARPIFLPSTHQMLGSNIQAVAEVTQKTAREMKMPFKSSLQAMLDWHQIIFDQEAVIPPRMMRRPDKKAKRQQQGSFIRRSANLFWGHHV